MEEIDTDKRNFLKYIGLAGVAGAFALADAKRAFAQTVLNDNQITTPAINAPTGRPVTLVVAASDSSAKGKSQADYVCDGAEDNVEIQAAINALPVAGGKIVLLDGNYQLAATLSRAIDNVSVSGMGYATYVKYNAVNRLFEVGTQNNWLFENFRMDFGGVELKSGTRWVLQNIWRDPEDTVNYLPMFIDHWSWAHKNACASDSLESIIQDHPQTMLYSGFESDSEWSNNGIGTFSYDTNIKYKGTRSVQIVTTNTGSQSYLLNTSSLPDLTNCSFSIMVYVDDYTALGSIELNIKSTEAWDGSWSNYGKWDANAIQAVNNSWFKLVFPYMQVGAGSPNYASPTLIRLIVKPVNGKTATVHLDNLCYWKRSLTPKGAVSFTFDDGLPTTYTNAKPKMDAYKFPGVGSFVVTRLSNLTSLAYAHDSQRAGWDVVSHSMDHNDNKTPSEPDYQYILSQKWLYDNGFKRGSRFALLHGGLNSADINAAVNNNLQIVRCSLHGYESLPGLGNLVTSWEIDPTVTLATIQGYIDTAKANGLWVILIFHDVVDSNPTKYGCLTSTFSSICDYCNSQGVEVLTFSQIMERINSSAANPVNTGTATIAGNHSYTTVVVQHNFAKIPSRITISPTSDTAGKRYWVSAKTATTFTISLDSAHTADITFDWTAAL